MKERIQTILMHEGITATKFAEEIGVLASSVSHILSGRNKLPSTDFLIKLLERYSWVNPEWLLLGKGNMYKSNHVTFTTDTQKNNSEATTQIPKNADTTKSDNDILSKKISTQMPATFPADQPEMTPKIERKIEQHPVYQQVTEPKKLQKIVLLYADNTFEVYNQNR